jgi:alcohol dehydrogenase class IV
MDKFSFYAPVKTYFKYDKYEILNELTCDVKNIGVISGKTAIEKTGFKAFLKESFNDKNFFFFSEVEENPSINTIIKGAKFLKRNRCEIAIGFGGGSSLDATKAIACFVENSGGFYELFERKNLNPSLKSILIPTTCGTGSEANNYCIITDVEKRDKINFFKETTFGDYALLFPEYLKFLSDETLISTIFDAFTHAFEGYISLRSTPFSDDIAKVAMKNILSVLKSYEDSGSLDYDLALYSSTLAGFVILHTGTTFLHAMGYYLTNVKNIHHGKANALLLPKYIKMLKDANVKKCEDVLSLLDKLNFDMVDFIEKFYKDTKIKEILCEEEIPKFITYSIGKKNTEYTPINANYENIVRYFL